MESIEVFNVTGITVGDAVFVQAIGQRTFLDWEAFLLAVMAFHENNNMSLIRSSVVFCGVRLGRKSSVRMLSVLPGSSGGSFPNLKKLYLR